jgi:uncharacterized phiE125 gp8 family phage protein
VTLADAKAHLRLDDGNEDLLLTSLIRTAREISNAPPASA